MNLKTLLPGLGLLIAGIYPCLAADSHSNVQLTQSADRVRVEINGAFFTDYIFSGAPHVYYYPLIGPGNAPMTRDYPMKPDTTNEEHDHPHHRSLWYAHGDVNGVDFWTEDSTKPGTNGIVAAPKKGKIIHDKFLKVESGADSGVIVSTDKWVAPDGAVYCTDQRTFRVYNRPANERVFDFEITIFAPADKQVVFGDTKEGAMALRLNETMRLKPNKTNTGKPGGHIVQSTGVLDDATWGKRAEWCDYSGPVEGKTLGIAMFDNPQNPVHPTYWHVRDYGLFAANPFGIHDFEKKPAGAGNFTIAAGQSATFKYRFYIHEGDEKSAKVAERYQDYAKTGAKDSK